MASPAKERIVFVSSVTPGRSEASALLLAESVRRFAGNLSRAPIWLYVSPSGKLRGDVEERLLSLGVDLKSFTVEGEAARFFFLPEVMVAGEAEARADGSAETIAWLGSNTIVLREPADLVLPPGKTVGYRPVHITNVGSPIDHPLDPFWSLIYRYCRVTPDRVFPMRTHVDGATLRPYFNAGCLAVRPESHLLRRWRDRLMVLCRNPDFVPFLREERYRIFMHQAVLAGVILAGFHREELLELPPTYNYPSHLHEEDVSGDRPETLDGMVTIRHEGFFEDPRWEEGMHIGEEAKAWMRETLSRIGR
jgi:hypothetical protein